jgi:hypothetical protein
MGRHRGQPSQRNHPRGGPLILGKRIQKVVDHLMDFNYNLDMLLKAACMYQNFIFNLVGNFKKATYHG